MMVKPIFIIGLPRTGSTLWSNVIAKESSIMRFGEMHFLNPWHKDIRAHLKLLKINLNDDTDLSHFIEKLFDEDSSNELHGNYWRQIQRIEPENLKKNIIDKLLHSKRRLSDLFTILVNESTLIRGCRRCLIKFPVSVSQVRYLFDWYPDSKIVHLTRDPRATALSKTSDPGGIAVRLQKYRLLRQIVRKVMLLFVVLQYVQSSYTHKRYNGKENYALFSYEDLVMNPEETISKFCQFADIEYSVEMTVPNKGQPSSVTGKRQKGFNTNSLYYWQDKLSSFEIKMITILTSSSMQRLGYQPEI